jgi:2-C-methyl-D-erythritol 2,4-cyclodiphosphate synthase
MLGGVHIPFEKGLKGHSDADALLHALSDAILGALNLRDIGFHFPDTDPKYKGADSLLLLKEVGRMAKEKGYVLGNCDCTIVAEQPKLNPHVPKMQEAIAGALEVSVHDISIKATTSEKMGFVGREEGLKAYAVVLMKEF